MKQVRDSFLYTCGYILGLIAQWGLTVIIVQLTGLDDSGYFALAMSICSVFFFVASYGMRSYQISDIDGQFSDATYISSRVFTTLAGFALCALYSVSSGYSWHQIQIILLYMLFRCCEALYDVLHGIWQQHNNLYNVGLSLVIKAVVNFLAFLIPYYLSRNLEIGLACMIASAIVLLTADAYFTGRYVTLVDMRHVQSGDVIPY